MNLGGGSDYARLTGRGGYAGHAPFRHSRYQPSKPKRGHPPESRIPTRAGSGRLGQARAGSGSGRARAGSGQARADSGGLGWTRVGSGGLGRAESPSRI
jgi:hypothetical protein